MTYGLIKIGLAVLACIITLCSSLVAHARQADARLAITGRVSPALKLSFGEVKSDFYRGLSVTVEQSVLSSAIITLRSNEISPSHIIIPLEIRTNVAYEVRLEPLSLGDCSPELAARVSSIRASGKSCAAQAVEVSEPAGPFNLTKTSDAIVILAGPRVSLGGGLASPANALMADLNIDLDESKSSCSWQAAFRITLEQATNF